MITIEKKKPTNNKRTLANIHLGRPRNKQELPRLGYLHLRKNKQNKNKQKRKECELDAAMLCLIRLSLLGFALLASVI